MLVQLGKVKSLYGKQPEGIDDMDWKELQVKVVATIKIYLADDVIYHIMDEKSSMAV